MGGGREDGRCVRASPYRSGNTGRVLLTEEEGEGCRADGGSWSRGGGRGVASSPAGRGVRLHSGVGRPCRVEDADSSEGQRAAGLGCIEPQFLESAGTIRRTVVIQITPQMRVLVAI